MTEALVPFEATEEPAEEGFAHGNIFPKNKELWRWPTKPGREPERITDCLIHVMCVFRRQVTADVSVHELSIRLIKKNGEVVNARLSHDVMEDFRKWNVWAGANAQCNWNVNADNRKELKDYVMAQPGAEHLVTELMSWGYQADFGVWFIEGMAIDAAGGRHTPIVDTPIEMVCSDGKTRAFVYDKSRAGSSVPAAPSTHFEVGVYPTGHALRSSALDKSRSDIQTLCAFWRTNLGNNAGVIALGYLMAHHVSHAVFKERRCFPHLYIYGAWSHGKDTFATVLTDIAGMPESSVLKAGSGNTIKGIRNELGYGAGWPAWLNEVQNTEGCHYLLDWIKNGFDRQGSAITNVKQQRIYHPISRSMMLVGQDILGSDAEISRYVLLSMKRYVSKESLAQVRLSIPPARKGWMTLLCDNKNAAEQVTKSIPIFEALLRDKTGCDDRRAYSWACAAAGAAYLYSGSCSADPAKALPIEVLAEIIERCVQSMETSASLGVLSNFWDSVAALHAGGLLPNEGPARWVENRAGTIRIWMHFLIERVAAQRRLAPSKTLILDELRGDKLFIGEKAVRFRYWKGTEPVDITRKVVLISERCRLIPEWMREIAYKVPEGQLTTLERAEMEAQAALTPVAPKEVPGQKEIALDL